MWKSWPANRRVSVAAAGARAVAAMPAVGAVEEKRADAALCRRSTAPPPSRRCSPKTHPCRWSTRSIRPTPRWSGCVPRCTSPEHDYADIGLSPLTGVDVAKVKQIEAAKPTVLVINSINPWVINEVEPGAAAVLATFDFKAEALVDVVRGRFKPSGKLPLTIPADQAAVDRNAPDVRATRRLSITLTAAVPRTNTSTASA